MYQRSILSLTLLVVPISLSFADAGASQEACDRYAVVRHALDALHEHCSSSHTHRCGAFGKAPYRVRTAVGQMLSPDGSGERVLSQLLKDLSFPADLITVTPRKPEVPFDGVIFNVEDLNLNGVTATVDVTGTVSVGDDGLDEYWFRIKLSRKADDWYADTVSLRGVGYKLLPPDTVS